MESPIFRAALVLLVIAGFFVSENQIANTVGVALGVGAYFCLSYLKTPPSPSPSPSPSRTDIQDLKQVIERNHDILKQQNEGLRQVIERNHDILTQQNAAQIQDLKQVIQRHYDILTQQNAPAHIQDLKQQIAILIQKIAPQQLPEVLTKQIQDLPAKMENGRPGKPPRAVTGDSGSVLDPTMAGLVPRDTFAASEPEFAGAVSSLAETICQLYSTNMNLIPCKSAFLKNPFPYHEVDPRFFSPVGSIRGALGITTRNPGTFWYVKMFTWPPGVEPSGLSFNKKDIATHKKKCKVVATYFVAGNTSTFFLAPKAPVNLWELVCNSPKGMAKEEFQKMIEDGQFEELQKKGAYTFPPCTATGAIKTDFLVCNEWNATDENYQLKWAHYEVQSVAGNMHDQNAVKCDLLA
jgi:hypothetical protein